MQNEHLFPEINDCSMDLFLSFSPIFDRKSAEDIMQCLLLSSFFFFFFHEFDVTQRVVFHSLLSLSKFRI